MNGKTIEINNTDAEGRLILADALAYAVDQGAERIVDLATLTGAVLFALGHTYAGLWSNDDDWLEQVRGAGDASGEIGWRMPLHPEYFELTKGTVADLQNAAEQRVGAVQLRRRVPAPVRRRPPLGARRHRRNGLGHDPELRRQGRQRIRHPDADRTRSQRGFLTVSRGFPCCFTLCDMDHITVWGPFPVATFAA